ncbi:MAG TPA: lytic transglycosylase domain-containing protein [Bradyrhizobium sp.]|nr:lytic transglycosylase domain-containing protein [Bradyrhizobium sp.]
MKLTTTQAKIAALIEQVRQAPGIPTAWLPVSYVMAHVRIESGFDATVKAGDFATTGSVGLMQVEATTARQVAAQYPAAKLTLAQTDPYTSLCTGMLYLRDCYDYLLPVFDAPLLYRHVCVAYNEGPGNAAKGIADSAYYYKWYSAQQDFAFLDTDPTIAAA